MQGRRDACPDALHSAGRVRKLLLDCAQTTTAPPVHKVESNRQSSTHNRAQPARSPSSRAPRRFATKRRVPFLATTMRARSGPRCSDKTHHSARPNRRLYGKSGRRGVIRVCPISLSATRNESISCASDCAPASNSFLA